MTSEKEELLKDTNPTAYEELIEFMPIYGYSSYKKETLPSELTQYLGVWQCPTGKHKWISTISYRANTKSDPGCIICLNNKLRLIPKLIEQRLHYTGNRFILESFLYNTRTYAIYWKRENLDTYDFSTYSDNYESPYSTLKEMYPILAEEWTTNNIASADKIFPNDYCNYEFEWKCRKCGGIYKASFDRKIRTEKYACPYCNGRLPFFEDSLAGKFPEISRKWVPSLNGKPPEQLFVSPNEWAHFKCSECGVIYSNSTENEVYKECEFCRCGVTLQYSERLYREARFNKDYLPPDMTTPIFWTCEECENSFNASPYNRFHKKASCPYCSGKYAIRGKTSLKALYPKIESQLIKDELVNFDTDSILPTDYSSRYFNWHCIECGNSFQATISKQIEGSDCPYCSGRLAIPGKTSFRALYPEIESQLIKDELVNFDTDSILPTDYSSRYFNWHCIECGNSFQATISKQIEGSDCPYCSGRLAIPGKTSFKALYPEIESQLIKDELVKFDTDNIVPTSYSYIRFNWYCNKCEKIFKATIQERIEGSRCVYCEARANSIFTLYTELINREWKFQNNTLLTNPRYELPSSKLRVWWICPICNNAYSYPINKRVKDYLRNRNSCTICKGRMRVKHRN
ncbi:zinc-ribbon domain-containing protein [Aminipila sp.]|uniref:zinc-ribbon domain-containing protein n=1 Tax=Aminipila sp. TaxID=2060095 RepID=UPI00289E1859|nr:zinc-ribbon domain-containing protein [Aminipila sp.]